MRTAAQGELLVRAGLEFDYRGAVATAKVAMTLRTLVETLQASDTRDSWTVADTRKELRWLITALHHHRAREAHLIFDGVGIDIAAS